MNASAIFLGLVFEWSGVAKLASRDAWQIEGTPFATPSRFANRVLRNFLPWGEVLLGGLLILRWATLIVGTVAVGVLAAFTFALVRVLRRGERPVCMCFGVSRARPVSWMSVARNVGLIALAVTAVAAA